MSANDPKRNGRYSLRLDASEVDDFCPLLGLIRDEICEFRRRHRHGRNPKLNKLRLRLGISDDGVDLFVKFADDLGAYGFGCHGWNCLEKLFPR